MASDKLEKISRIFHFFLFFEKSEKWLFFRAMFMLREFVMAQNDRAEKLVDQKFLFVVGVWFSLILNIF